MQILASDYGYTLVMTRVTGLWLRLQRRCRIRHVAGLRRPPGTAKVVLLCRVQNGAEYISDFLRHYRSLGVDHMIFLDTGSSDGTMALLTGDDVTVYRASVPFKDHRLWMRRWLIRRCRDGVWTLNVDIDELFDYPLSGKVSLQRLASYLEGRGHGAMRAHMLDMFSSGKIGSSDAPEGLSLLDCFPWYDLTDIASINEPVLFGGMPAYRGGVRKAAFGSEHFWLTKHPFIRKGGGVEVFTDNEHTIHGVHTADITGVLLHFKFTRKFDTYVHDAVVQGQHWNESAEYKLYADALLREPELSLKKIGAERWTGVDVLVEKGFLQMSDAYRQYAGAGV